MLTRQKTLLALLSLAKKPLSPTVFVKLVFLLRHETPLKRDPAFYDFVPYKYGPFSFTLYHEITNLRRDGYVMPEEEQVALCDPTLRHELAPPLRREMANLLDRYAGESPTNILKDVYSRYPWYATKSELADLRPPSSVCAQKAPPAVYTTGYQGKSVDFFFDQLLRRGIGLVIDVRAVPLSRRYGFSKRQFSEIAGKLGLDYRHIPTLGIPSRLRAHLTGFDSYQRLLDQYERDMLPGLEQEIVEVGRLMRQTPAVLVCVEKDVHCCHRGRLAEAVSRRTALKVEHLP